MRLHRAISNRAPSHSSSGCMLALLLLQPHKDVPGKLHLLGAYR
jgi:hypothetical protein